jgi:hypothetical protein
VTTNGTGRIRAAKKLGETALKPPLQPSPGGASGSQLPPEGGSLDRKLCQVGGLNLNYSSVAGTPYHIQIEDRGPIVDRVSEREVRRVNLIIYSNYGEPNARIVHGWDYDFADMRSQEHNRLIEQKIQEIASEARQIIEEKEQRQVFRIKCLIRDYYRTRDEATKREFEEANGLYPFLFSRAWRELRDQRMANSNLTSAIEALTETGPPASRPLQASALPEGENVDFLYPLDAELRERVLEIERIIIALGQDVHRLKNEGRADDILLQTCRKLVTRAKESLSGREPSEFNARRLDMIRNGLLTTWRQVRSRLK